MIVIIYIKIFYQQSTIGTQTHTPTHHPTLIPHTISPLHSYSLTSISSSHSYIFTACTTFPNSSSTGESSSRYIHLYRCTSGCIRRTGYSECHTCCICSCWQSKISPCRCCLVGTSSSSICCIVGITTYYRTSSPGSSPSLGSYSICYTTTSRITYTCHSTIFCMISGSTSITTFRSCGIVIPGSSCKTCSV